ncbi:MAG: spherulation-specific family 4 protein [Schlesneria sp.]
MVRQVFADGCVCMMTHVASHSAVADDAKADRKPTTKLLVPAYFYPAGEGLKTWNRLIDSHAPEDHIEIVAIANINSGNVGSTVDSNYADVIGRAARKGLTVIAYITSDYANAHGAASLETAKTNVTNWFKLYPQLHGIFIDEQTSDGAAIVSYYEPLRKHIRSINPKALVIGNPGNNCVEDYLVKRADGPIMDVVIIHENNEKKAPYAAAVPAAWMSNYHSDRFAMLVHTSATFGKQLRLARNRGTGYVFVTDAVGPPPDTIHPWGTLPTYWEDELQMIGALNGKR